METASNGTRNDHVRLSMTSIPTVENFSMTGFGASPIVRDEDDAELEELEELEELVEVVLVLVLGRCRCRRCGRCRCCCCCCRLVVSCTGT